MKRNKGFTLIELLAVIVILAILALIAIPIVISIINDSRENSHKRSIQAYGRSVENAIATWQSKNDGELPKYLSDYKVKTSGEKVQCDNEIIGINSEEGIELTNCRVVDSKGKSKSREYQYKNGQVEKSENNSTEYHVGDKIQVRGEYYYVISNSPSGQDYVIALKENPLTEDEVNRYGAGHVNMYNESQTSPYYHKSYKYSGYGGMAYYSSTTCGYRWTYTGCNPDFNQSEVKYAINAWAADKFQNNELKTVDNYSARLITSDDLANNLGYAPYNEDGYLRYRVTESTPDWVYKGGSYWTMTPDDREYGQVFCVTYSSILDHYSTYTDFVLVRPVINVYKTAIESN